MLKKSIVINSPIDFRKQVPKSCIDLLVKLFGIISASNEVFCSISNNQYGVIIVKQIV